jgi:hypothetical protein
VASLEQLLSLLAEPKSSVQLQEHLGVSQATVSRLLRRAGERVVRLGAGPTTRYVASHDVFDVQSTAKLFSVNDRGVVGELAVLRALADGRYLVEGRDLPKWLRGESDTGLFEDLPYFCTTSSRRDFSVDRSRAGCLASKRFRLTRACGRTNTLASTCFDTQMIYPATSWLVSLPPNVSTRWPSRLLMIERQSIRASRSVLSVMIHLGPRPRVSSPSSLCTNATPAT